MTIESIRKLLLELLRITLGTQMKLSHNPSYDEWKLIYIEAIKQSVAGLLIEGIQSIVKDSVTEIGLKVDSFLQWYGVHEQIHQRNLLLNERSVELSKLISEAGFRSCILKGQGNALMYPNPFSRTAGDIDIWVDGAREDIRDYIISSCSEWHDGAKHIEANFFKDASVEVHYTPSTLRIPRYNKRLQSFFREHGSFQFNNKVTLPYCNGNICVPTANFNVVMQMSHLMSHFYVEGIGLRQFVDYFYVLNQKPVCHASYKSWEDEFNYFGVLKFARGVMWIEKNCLGLKEEYLLVKPDECIGRLIEREMLEGGNFGYYDERYKARRRGYFSRNLIDIYRLIKLAVYFPQDCFWKVIKDIEGLKFKRKSHCYV